VAAGEIAGVVGAVDRAFGGSDATTAGGDLALALALFLGGGAAVAALAGIATFRGLSRSRPAVAAGVALLAFPLLVVGMGSLYWGGGVAGWW
jgi:hypothetical protein